MRKDIIEAVAQTAIDLYGGGKDELIEQVEALVELYQCRKEMNEQGFSTIGQGFEV